ncbi:MAG: hypothetical protein KME20_11485 [Kaiparowitsia implicata GSE-PSE-MK54-09C]|nr:hypothetical protein [Kaiparowitsia implicata GSE-PSE-MK54-09C]
MPTSPVTAAGPRIDPAVSVPVPNTPTLAAIAAAVPLLEPDASRLRR